MLCADSWTHRHGPNAGSQALAHRNDAQVLVQHRRKRLLGSFQTGLMPCCSRPKNFCPRHSQSWKGFFHFDICLILPGCALGEGKRAYNHLRSEMVGDDRWT